MGKYTRIIRTCSYIPPLIVPNAYFCERTLHYPDRSDPSGKTLKPTQKTAEQIYSITGINSRRWAEPEQTGLDLAVKACEQLDIVPEAVIFAHDSKLDNGQYAPIPAVAARIQGVRYPHANAFDILSNGSIDGAVIAHSYTVTGMHGVLVHSDATVFPHHQTATVEELCASAPRGTDDVRLFIVDHIQSLGAPRAQLLADHLGYRADCVDIIAGCPGFVVGLDLADRLIRAERYRTVLVLGAEKLTDLADADHLDSTLYSDGAGAVVVQAASTPGVLDSFFTTAGAAWEYLRLDEGVKDKTRPYLVMRGHDVYKLAVRKIPEVISTLMNRNDLSLKDVDALVIHQMNGKLLEAVIDRFLKSVSPESDLPSYIDARVPWAVDWLGNCSVATNPIVLDGVLNHRIRTRQSKEDFSLELGSGKNILLVSAGAGMIIGGNVVKL